MTSSFVQEHYNAVYPTNVEDIQQLYDNIAHAYDAEYKEFGYHGPTACFKTLEKWLAKDKDAHILDVACGTGLAGEELIKKGFTNLTIDGVDMSSESIRICEDKKIYNRFVCDKIGTNKLDIADDSYDCCICVGSFVPNHLNQECFPELIRITKPGGLILITMRESYIKTAPPFNEGRFEGAIQSFVQQGVWEVIERNVAEKHLGNHGGLTIVFKVK